MDYKFLWVAGGCIVASTFLYLRSKRQEVSECQEFLDSFKKDNVPEKNIKDDYYIFKGFIPKNLGSDNRKFAWDHAMDLQLSGTNTFIWCDGVWNSVVFNDSFAVTDDEFIVAPACTTYIRKNSTNRFLESTEKAFSLLGFSST